MEKIKSLLVNASVITFPRAGDLLKINNYACQAQLRCVLRQKTRRINATNDILVEGTGGTRKEN